jgi:rubrerythrin
MNLQEFIGQGIRLEESISRCYEQLADSSPGDRSRELLLKISGEETNHANTLRLGLEYVRKMPDLFGPQLMSSADLLAGIRQVEELLEEIVAHPEWRAQLERLLNLEKRFESIHMNTAVEIKEASIKKMFENIGREDSDHLEAITEILSLI